MRGCLGTRSLEQLGYKCSISLTLDTKPKACHNDNRQQHDSYRSPDFVSHCYIIILLLLTLICPCNSTIYSNNWAIRVNESSDAILIKTRHGFHSFHEIMPRYYLFYNHHINKRSVAASYSHNKFLSKDPKVLWFEQQIVRRRKKRDYIFNDIRYKHQWYLERHGSERRLLDMNVMSAWSQGYTGHNVVISILDDGIERDHPDLVNNYDSRASRDINGRDYDPTPRYEYTNENRHGTRCAGEVAASANNSICGVGVAYHSRIGGIRMLDGDVTDSVEAMALSFNRDHIDIYSASWGPDDNGKTVDGPGSLAREAFRDGVRYGRNGLGSIFVWASGNGGKKDSCNCDGYTNSIYTLSISSATENGNIPWYSEACSSTLATTYSSGDAYERKIVTTDLRKTCTDTHTGTSASAPLAAGIVALVLQANPNLTWRDTQYLVVMSSNPNNLKADDWIVNGVGRRVSHHFGYGMMNAGKMVDLAKNWTNVPPQRICEVVSPHTDQVILSQQKITLKLNTKGCESTSNHVVYLEHVQARVSLSSSYRGDITISLTSPMGTKSTLLSSRPHDDSKVGFNQWAFMTTHMWGEFSKGEWTLQIENGYRDAKPAVLADWTLVLYGTKPDPLEAAASKSKPAFKDIVRNVKSRDQVPDYPSYSNWLSESELRTLAKAGIIIPHLSNNIERVTPYHPPTFRPPVYKAHNRPKFEYVDKTKEYINGQKHQAIVHGDHDHKISSYSWSRFFAETSKSKEGTTPRASTLRDFTLVLHGTESNPVSGIDLPSADGFAYQSSCTDSEVLYRDECVDACPHLWYSHFGVCFPCHLSCASCHSASNHSCTECYHGSVLISGACISTDEAMTYTAGASSSSDGMTPNTLWWLMVGATIAVCLLVVFLVGLAVYYAYIQGYLCSNIYTNRNERNKKARATKYPPPAERQDNITPEQLRLAISQHSSQLELMSDSDCSDYEHRSVVELSIRL